jgi:hypothetical protein
MEGIEDNRLVAALIKVSQRIAKGFLVNRTLKNYGGFAIPAFHGGRR